MTRIPGQPGRVFGHAPAFPAILAVCLMVRSAAAAPPPADPDWPCQQPFVPSISAEMVWGGPPLDDAGNWRTDRTASALVAAIAPHEVSVEDGKAAIARFLRGHPPARTIKRAVVGLLDENNSARTRVQDHIKMLAERQRGLADVISRLTAERDKAGKDADPELVDRWTFAERTYNEVQRTMRYACEMPAELDQRLGLYAKALEAGLR
jgi:hypothetical protein